MQLWYLPKKEGDENDAPEITDFEEKLDIRKNITSEAVRLKFLKYNKLWLLHHLTAVLTPRYLHNQDGKSNFDLFLFSSIERNRPYLIDQYEQLIRQQAEGLFENVNEVSSDSAGMKSDDDKKEEVTFMIEESTRPFKDSSCIGLFRRLVRSDKTDRKLVVTESATSH